MKNNKGVSLTALVITIIIMVILAAITAPMLSSVIDDSLEQDARVELKNVQAVVENAKALILSDQFSPNPKYVISYTDLYYKFGAVLTADELNHIKAINESPSQKAPYKYYLMDKDAFADEFSTDFNVRGIRDNRQYLVNYMDTLVILNYNNMLISTKTEGTIIDKEELIRGEVDVTFSPNGNAEWKQQQATNIIFNLGEGTTVNSVQFVWSQDLTEPDESIYPTGNIYNNISDGDEIPTELIAETGNGWYVWVLVKYDDVGNERSKVFRSEPFYIDNIPPSATFSIDEITN